MTYRELTRRRGTPLILKGPVTRRTPWSRDFRRMTRLPRKRPARRMRTVPGWRDLRGAQDRTALRTCGFQLLACWHLVMLKNCCRQLLYVDEVQSSIDICRRLCRSVRSIYMALKFEAASSFKVCTCCDGSRIAMDQTHSLDSSVPISKPRTPKHNATGCKCIVIITKRLTFLFSASSSAGYHFLAFSEEAGTSRVDFPNVLLVGFADIVTLLAG